MTENKGAYINIGPDYKLQFNKFDAVPHPDVRPMVSSLLAPLRPPPPQTFPSPSLPPLCYWGYPPGRAAADVTQAYANNSIMSSLM